MAGGKYMYWYITVTSDDIQVCSGADRNTALQTHFRDNAAILFPLKQVLLVLVKFTELYENFCVSVF